MRLLERVLEAGQESELSGPPSSKELPRNRERDREREERKKDTGTKALKEQRSMLDLHCYAWPFSCCSDQGLLSSCGEWVSH